MGKSGARRKKAAAAGGSGAAVAEQTGGGNKGDHDSSIFLKKANDLKEEGNKKFQEKDYVGALEHYEQALKLTPKNHPDRAIYHSNKAACLMQMKPVKYESVVEECAEALEVHPHFSRALFRRARAYEAMGKLDLAMQDVQAFLQADSNHQDALDLSRRLRVALGNKQDTSDIQTKPPAISSYAGTSPAAVGASAVRGTPVGGMGPCLPARPVTKKKNKQEKPSVEAGTAQSNGPYSVEITIPRPAKTDSSTMKDPVLKIPSPSNPGSAESNNLHSQNAKASAITPKSAPKEIQCRPLKLIYDHDIRLSQMPEKCKFKDLRDIVRSRFASSKSVLIKYRDLDGDLVTITNTAELRLAEAAAQQFKVGQTEALDGTNAVGNKSSNKDSLRLYIVDVSPEQEPPIDEEEEEEEEKLPVEQEAETGKTDENVSCASTESNNGVTGSENKDAITESQDKDLNKKASLSNESSKEPFRGRAGDDDVKEVEIDDWLFEFAQLFRSQVGIDPDAHVDLHELGMELCTEALEETIASEEAQCLFDMAGSKFQEVAALAFFNWGNVYMCAARKKIPLDENAPKEVADAQLQRAYDWVHDHYKMAGQKYEEALRIKPDFYEGLLALGQQHFESAKLQWNVVIARKVDLGVWDSSETIKLFDSAEEKMRTATEMWERVEEQRLKDQSDPAAMKKEEILKRKRKLSGIDVDSSEEIAASAAEAEEQAKLMRSQIHLFWGNMLFERSQVEYRLGLPRWKERLDVAVERFELAGASSTEIETVLKNHPSNNPEGNHVSSLNSNPKLVEENNAGNIKDE